VVAFAGGFFAPFNTTLVIARWRDGMWRKDHVLPTSEQTVELRPGSLIMDGDAPTVSFEEGGRPRVVKLDGGPLDLGPVDLDATATTPRALLALPAADQPAVAWLDRASGGPSAPAVLEVSQRTAFGWQRLGGPFVLPEDRTHVHAIASNPAGATAIAIPTGGEGFPVEVRAAPGGERLCAPVLDAGRQGGSELPQSLGLAAHPEGGFVVAVGAEAVVVRRVRP
jgi:hypothetical protein